MLVSGRDEADIGSDKGSSTGRDDMRLSDAQIAGVMEFVNNAEIQQAQLARSKSKNQQVIQLASMIIEHHTQAKQQQAALGMSSATSPRLQKLSSEGQRTLAKLEEKSGREFDKAYVEAQVEQHQEVLDSIDREFLPNVQNAQLRRQVQQVRPTIEQHLQAARAAMTAIENGRSGQRPSGQERGGSNSSNRSGSNSSNPSGKGGPTQR